MTRTYQNHPRLDSTVEEGIKGWVDLLTVGVAIVAAYVVRFEQIPSGALSAQMLWMFATLPVLRLLIGRWSKTHRSLWRLFGLAEGWALTRTVLGVTVLLMASRLVMPVLLPDMSVIPMGVIALEGTFSLMLLLGVRVLVRMHDEQRARRSIKRAGKTERALLVGAGRAGRMAARELLARPDAGYEPVGFLDDDPLRVGKIVEGVPVLGSTARAAAVARELAADVLILTMPSVGRAKTRAVAGRCRAAGLPIRTVPGLYELLGGKVEITNVRPLKIEDLLGRDVVGFDELSARRVGREFTGRRILVTGAGGSIGSELCRQLAALRPAALILVDNHENHLFEIEQELRPKLGKRVIPCLVDIREVAEVEETFAKHRPEIVFHAAAFKHVPMMESHPIKAVLNNVRGTRVVAHTARAFGAERFVLISTDKAVNPTSVMGATKRAAEILVLGMESGPTRFSAVRFGNVLGSNGSVVHTFGRQIAEGGPITLTHAEITRYFMTIPEASRLVLQAAAIGKGGDLFILDMGEPVKIIELARQMIRLSGFEEAEIGIEIVGLRPGEKLYEELLADHEERQSSGVPSVWVSRSAASSLDDPGEWIRRLERIAASGDVEGTLLTLAAGTGYRSSSRPSVPEAQNGPRRGSLTLVGELHVEHRAAP